MGTDATALPAVAEAKQTAQLTCVKAAMLCRFAFLYMSGSLYSRSFSLSFHIFLPQTAMTRLDNWIYKRLGGGRHAGRPRRTNPPRPPAPRRPPIALHPRHDQLQSPLFSTGFSAELRILIYEAVLGDPVRPMHIVPYEDGSKRVGHYRCEDMGSPYPTWQHKCFGIWHDEVRRARCYRPMPYTNDEMLAFLLSCRLMYVQPCHVRDL